jgi:hypothetical protein
MGGPTGVIELSMPRGVHKAQSMIILAGPPVQRPNQGSAAKHGCPAPVSAESSVWR